jgi:hypothetical protein
MKPIAGLLAIAFSCSSLLLLAADPPKKESDKFVPLFNGKDLTGWVNVNCAPGSFYVKENEIITTGEPIGFMRTEKQYENFILEMEWMHVREKGMANSGLFVWGDALPGLGSPFTRGIEVQILINFETDWATSHGDVFSVQAAKCIPDRPHPKGYARCLPSERRVKGAKEWNHYKVIAQDGTIKLHVNGKEVSGVSGCTPRKGYLALESEGSECHFRNIKIQELPSSNVKAEMTATVDEGHRSIFDGLTLNGWKADKEAWKAQGGMLKSSGKTAIVYGEKLPAGELLFDWKVNSKEKKPMTVTLSGKVFELVAPPVAAAGAWTRSRLPLPPDATLTVEAQPGLELTNVFFNKK